MICAWANSRARAHLTNSKLINLFNKRFNGVVQLDAMFVDFHDGPGQDVDLLLDFRNVIGLVIRKHSNFFDHVAVGLA